ncbi:hypothetical protein [Granulicella sp. S156]|uniref:hypothetical protein n=1 Tax=Granulicella sp. S156 TaxID=1747224 RepID=UPI00131DBD3F|nr:hypothetical protein [Granulicella sp. S156]
MMLKISILFPLILWSGLAAHSQSNSSELLRGASHCLVVEDTDWLSVQKSHAKSVRVSYAIDTVSYPGERTIYVVAYADSGRASGKIFDLIYHQRGRKTIFDVQNNSSFLRSGNKIDFVDPPLGGVWTQRHLIRAIRRAERRPEVLFDVKELSASSPGVICKSFVGSQ